MEESQYNEIRDRMVQEFHDLMPRPLCSHIVNVMVVLQCVNERGNGDRWIILLNGIEQMVGFGPNSGKVATWMFYTLSGIQAREAVEAEAKKWEQTLSEERKRHEDAKTAVTDQWREVNNASNGLMKMIELARRARDYPYPIVSEKLSYTFFDRPDLPEGKSEIGVWMGMHPDNPVDAYIKIKAALTESRERIDNLLRLLVQIKSFDEVMETGGCQAVYKKLPNGQDGDRIVGEFTAIPGSIYELICKELETVKER